MVHEHTVRRDALALENYVQAMYRELHTMPERSGQETETNKVIRRELDAMGVSYAAPKDNLTIATIRGAQPGHVVGLRCDTDALPVQEETGLPFASSMDGMMHACGHDGHTAIGLATARLLKRYEDEMAGTVKIIFQPAEEIGKGAGEAIATGLLNDVETFFAIHLWSPYESGTLRVSPIVVSAAVSSFTITVTGKGGHGATPHLCSDALLCASELVTALQSIVSRHVSPTEPAVLTVGTLQAGTAYNIVAEQAVMTGTIRTVGGETRLLIEEKMNDLAHGIARAHGCTATVQCRHHHDEVRNDPGPSALAKECALLVTSSDRVLEQRTMMLGDDFCDYRKLAPCCYVQVGIADADKGTDAAHHNGKFKVDESVLPVSVAWMTLFALRAGERGV